MPEKSVSYVGNNRGKDLTSLDEALKENGNFGVYGDLSDGLVSLLSYMYVSVERQENKLIVSAAPLSGEGHDFSFVVNLLNKEIDNVVIGEVLPQPEF